MWASQRDGKLLVCFNRYSNSEKMYCVDLPLVMQADEQFRLWPATLSMVSPFFQHKATLFAIQLHQVVQHLPLQLK